MNIIRMKLKYSEPQWYSRIISEYRVIKTTMNISWVLYDNPTTFLLAKIFKSRSKMATKCKKSPISWNTSIYKLIL